MLKLLGLDVVFAVVGNVYLLLVLAGVCMAFWKGKTWKRKLLFATLVVAVAVSPIAPEIYRGVQYRSKLAKTQVVFAERCKTAGETIHRTVDGVDGLMILKLRPITYSPENQFAVDPYGYDFDWINDNDNKPDPYIGTFLIGKDEKGNYQENGPIVLPGYQYVEAIDRIDGLRYRYTGKLVEPWLTNKHYSQGYHLFVVDRTPAVGLRPRYGITYDDISTSEERGQWIAGSSLKIIDLQTNEVIAERIGYMVDFAFGSTSGFRQPWTFARKSKGWSCPAINDQSYGARRFVEKVLRLPDSKPDSSLSASK